MMGGMEPFKVTVTPEQQAALQARMEEIAQGFMQMRDHPRANIPALRMAARLDEALQQQAVAPTTARG